MAITRIPGAYADNTTIAMVGEAIRQTSVGIGVFDGYAANVAALPTAAADNNGKEYLVGDKSTPYASDGSAWIADDIIPVWKGAKFYIVESGNITGEGVFTTKPTYDDFDNPTTASGGVCRVLTMGAERALTNEEINAALTAAGF